MLEVKHVTKAYAKDGTPAIEDISFTVEPGKIHGLIGPNGSGKTTLIKCITGILSTTEGEILLDGKNIKELTLQSLRGSVGVVQQDVYLFSGSVYENIAYGKPGASREEVIEAAKLAGAHAFIEELTM